MIRLEAFWDSSAIVPLCVPQAFSSPVQALLSKYSMTVWWATPVEIVGAIARLLRIGGITAATWKASRAYSEGLTGVWWVISPSRDVLSSAMSLVDRYDVHAADALQLAAALKWAGNSPEHKTFLTLDNRLRDAALLCGFDAPQI